MPQWSRIRLAMQETPETWVRSLGREDPLEEEMATHSSVLAWRIPCTEEPGGLQSMGSKKKLDTTEHTANTHTHTQMPLTVSPTWTVFSLSHTLDVCAALNYCLTASFTPSHFCNRDVQFRNDLCFYTFSSVYKH